MDQKVRTGASASRCQPRTNRNELAYRKYYVWRLLKGLTSVGNRNEGNMATSRRNRATYCRGGSQLRPDCDLNGLGTRSTVGVALLGTLG
jgi:hypothetical protein